MSAARPRNGRSPAPAVLGLVLLSGVAAHAAADAATRADAFDRAFPTRGEPASLSYEVQYEDASGTHRLRVWRDGRSRFPHLRRSTDDTLDLLVERGTDDELQMTLVDHRRRIATAVSRTALYKVGHGLGMPYTVMPLERTSVDAKPIAACRWMELTTGERRSHICWSARLGLPLLIAAQPSGRLVWRVVASQVGPLQASAFATAAPGYVRVNADDDIRAD